MPYRAHNVIYTALFTLYWRAWHPDVACLLPNSSILITTIKTWMFLFVSFFYLYNVTSSSFYLKKKKNKKKCYFYLCSAVCGSPGGFLRPWGQFRGSTGRKKPTPSAKLGFQLTRVPFTQMHISLDRHTNIYAVQLYSYMNPAFLPKPHFFRNAPQGAKGLKPPPSLDSRVNAWAPSSLHSGGKLAS